MYISNNDAVISRVRGKNAGIRVFTHKSKTLVPFIVIRYSKAKSKEEEQIGAVLVYRFRRPPLDVCGFVAAVALLTTCLYLAKASFSLLNISVA